MRDQSTLNRPLRITGVGLHSGRHATALLQPAPPDHGIVFYRSDVDSFVPARAEEAGHFDHATTLGPHGREVGTVEHLLSAAFGIGLDNVLVEIDGPEIPILDGSAAPWTRAFREAGVVRQGRPIAPFMPTRTIVVPGGGGKRLEIRPGRELRVTYTIDFPHPVIGRQSLTVVVSPESYMKHVAPARTFGFLAEYEQLKAHGLARGASAHNCIVVGHDRIENGELRFPDEFVRHKVLDLLGDLALVGRPILGHVIAHRAGHSLHAALARLLREESRGANVATAVSAGSRSAAFADAR
ncbi:MAG TPA: UDP-3-O-acyl-N-acetylglucosamine deacetylase [Thermoanaerobaculia bacterium]|nr:UDP-3-O-acyl-N-acetylglucosamine deacetylase [Thermoanaerobaculia bacterium]